MLAHKNCGTLSTLLLLFIRETIPLEQAHGGSRQVLKLQLLEDPCVELKA